MGKTLTAKELSELLQLKEGSTCNLYEKIQDMLERIIKDWLEKRTPPIEYNKEENKKLITSQSNRLYNDFKRYEITGLDDEAIQLLESQIKEALVKKTKPHHERKKMITALNHINWMITRRIRESMKKE